tara:strand:+ start:110 stop:838 length:729 start_codon:yes stop_codon:yes gene_type:complete
MKTRTLMLVALFVTTIGFSQNNPNNTYMSTFTYKAKAGMVDKFENAAKKKTKMFNKEEGSIIFTYRVLTGNNSGAYERYLVGQSNKSYDMDRSEELEYWAKNVAPYADPVGGQVRWMWEEWATIGDQPEPPKYLHKTVMAYKPGMESYVNRIIYRSGKVLEKRNPNAFRRVFSPVSGADVNIVVVFTGFDEFGREWTADSTWEEDYNEMFGWEQYSTDSKMRDKSLREYNGITRITLEKVDW